MLSVLVVEDHQAVREALVASFLGWGYSVASASTLDEAIALLTERTFDLVVTDVDLGGANGLELVKWLGTSQPQVPFIVMSGRFGPKEIFGNLFGASSRFKYLQKPFLLSQLQAAVADLCDRGAAMSS
jgi:two-component system response regulator HydG